MIELGLATPITLEITPTANGVKLSPAPAPDGPPTWSVADPGIALLTPGATPLDVAVLAAGVAGSTTITAGVVYGGALFTTTVQVEYVPPPPVVDGVEIDVVGSTPPPSPEPPVVTPPVSANPVVTIYTVRNLSQGAISDAAVAQACAAVVDQMTKSYSPAPPQGWGVAVAFQNRSTQPICYCDFEVGTAPEDGVLGEHTVDDNGQPHIHVFIDQCLTYGVGVSDVLSHEVGEALVDPTDGSTATAPDGSVWALEVGDPFQGFTYQDPASGDSVQDLALPNYFRAGAPPPYDLMGVATAPFQILAGANPPIVSGPTARTKDDANRHIAK